MALPYSPLNKATDEIRLLTLLPGGVDACVQCVLKQTPLGSYSKHKEGTYRWNDGRTWPPGEEVDELDPNWVPSYEALSYTWGNQSVKYPVEINGYTFGVGWNLFTALKCFRKQDKQRIIWIDAICIDQNNIQERNEQVPRMRSIYQRATGVLIWLGEASDDSDLGLDLVKGMGGSKEDLERFKWDDFDWIGPHVNPEYFESDPNVEVEIRNRSDAMAAYMKSLKRLDPSTVNEAGWVALDRFFNHRQWWMRTWVIQEVANAQAVSLSCGTKSIEWDSLMHLVIHTPDPNHARLRALLQKSGAAALVSQREATREAHRAMGFELESRSFLKLLIDFRAFKATDPRDKVYALLGLASMSRDLTFPPIDYSDTKPVREVFCEIALAIIENTRDLGVLCLTHSSSDFNLPSWAPDWTTQPEAYEFFDPTWTESRYHASGDRTAEGPSLRPVSDTSRCRRREEGLMVYNINRKSETGTDGLINRLPPAEPSNISLGADMCLSLDGIFWDDVDRLGDCVSKEQCVKKVIKVFRIFMNIHD